MAGDGRPGGGPGERRFCPPATWGQGQGDPKQAPRSLGTASSLGWGTQQPPPHPRRCPPTCPRPNALCRGRCPMEGEEAAARLAEPPPDNRDGQELPEEAENGAGGAAAAEELAGDTGDSGVPTGCLRLQREVPRVEHTDGESCGCLGDPGSRSACPAINQDRRARGSLGSHCATSGAQPGPQGAELRSLTATLALQVEQMLSRSPWTGRGAPSSQPWTVSVPGVRHSPGGGREWERSCGSLSPQKQLEKSLIAASPSHNTARQSSNPHLAGRGCCGSMTRNQRWQTLSMDFPN